MNPFRTYAYMQLPVWERIRLRLEYPDSGCWIFTGPKSRGYGHIGHQRREVATHRVSYEHHVGPIPAGMQIDHLCRQRACCNPEHLEVVTQRENIHRSEAPTIVQFRTGFCKRGHPQTPENRVAYPSLPHGTCRPCINERRAERRARTVTEPIGESS